MSSSALPPQEGISTGRTQMGQPEEILVQPRRWLTLARDETNPKVVLPELVRSGTTPDQ